MVAMTAATLKTILANFDRLKATSEHAQAENITLVQRLQRAENRIVVASNIVRR
jgi:hypothetical protein